MVRVVRSIQSSKLATIDREMSVQGLPLLPQLYAKYSPPPPADTMLLVVQFSIWGPRIQIQGEEGNSYVTYKHSDSTDHVTSCMQQWDNQE